MAWFLLFVSGLLETVWAVALKQSEGFSKVLPTAVFLVSLTVSMLLLAKGAKEIPIGTAYAVWVGIGATGTALIGIFYLGESASPMRLGFLFLLVVSLIGLRFS